MTDAIDPFMTPEGNKNYLEEFVGEGKKFKSPEDLAKGKKEADDFIEVLKSELAQERQKAQDGKSIAELLEALKQEKTEPNSGQPIGTPEVPNSYKPEDIETIALTAIKKLEAERQTNVNYSQSVSKMNEVWGTDAPKKLAETAKALNVSVDYLKEVAKQSSSAFVNLVGLNSTRSAPAGTTVPTSTVNFGGNNNGKRTMAFYRKLKLENPKLHADQKTQIQMSRDALAMGEEFFD